MLESLFFLFWSLQHRCSPVKFAKFLSTLFLTKNLLRLLLILLSPYREPWCLILKVCNAFSLNIKNGISLWSFQELVIFRKKSPEDFFKKTLKKSVSTCTLYLTENSITGVLSKFYEIFHTNKQLLLIIKAYLLSIRPLF